MEKPQFLQELNQSQRDAVEYIDGPSLVIAGAGSGKTRVLTYKIAYLLLSGIKPWEIMALTFTNKAAREMKERIAVLVGDSVARYLRMGTFHSVFAQILRSEANQIGYNSNFTIYDEADSRSLCKAVIKELQLDEKTYKPSDIHCRISSAKNRLMLPQDYDRDLQAYERDSSNNVPKTSQIYKLYNTRCRQSNAMDFDDLLLNTYLLFKNNPEIRDKYASSFKFFLVDEYQDTNYAQQQIILQLASLHQHVCVVGDDAQSIYGFRGANIDNILDFTKQYQGAKQFKLEQNYRSTQRIVQAANSLIHHNERQIHKEVYSKNAEGDNLLLCELASDREEAIYICKDIKQKVRYEGMKYDDFAILYRTNYQSRTFEEQMMKMGMPYKIYGGMSFYQRKEIKDIVAYFRLVANPDDEEAFKRIINYPARGIGDATVSKIILAAREANMSLWQVLSQPERTSLNVTKGTMTKLQGFKTQMESFMERIITDDAFTLGCDIVRQTGVHKEIYSSSEPEYLSRQENLEEFMSSMQEFVESQREQGEQTGLLDFLHDVALLSDRDDDDDTAPKITLMTIHSSKGLEFPCVYIVGMEENIFPSPMCTDSKRLLEEERRLLYVAITRAEKKCTMTYAKSRYRYGKMEFDAPSRFLRDIDRRLMTFDNAPSASNSFSIPQRKPLYPNERKPLFQDEKPRQTFITTNRFTSGKTQQPTQQRHVTPQYSDVQKLTPMKGLAKGNASPAICQNITVGDAVAHNTFGNGIVTAIEGTGESTKLIVDFKYAGTKHLLLKFAKLQKLQ